MLDLPQITEMLDAFVLPMLGSLVLCMAKLTRGETARWAERQFYAALVVITMVTLRTVVLCDDTWLLHTSTLAMMIVGGLVIPSQDAAAAY